MNIKKVPQSLQRFVSLHSSARLGLNNTDRATPAIVFTVLKPYYRVVTLNYKLASNLSSGVID